MDGGRTGFLPPSHGIPTTATWWYLLHVMGASHTGAKKKKRSRTEQSGNHRNPTGSHTKIIEVPSKPQRSEEEPSLHFFLLCSSVPLYRPRKASQPLLTMLHEPPRLLPAIASSAQSTDAGTWLWRSLGGYPERERRRWLVVGPATYQLQVTRQRNSRPSQTHTGKPQIRCPIFPSTCRSPCPLCRQHAMLGSDEGGFSSLTGGLAQRH